MFQREACSKSKNLSALEYIHERGEYLVYLSEGDVPFSGHRFHTCSSIFSRKEVSKECNFSGPVVETCQNGKFVRSGY